MLGVKMLCANLEGANLKVCYSKNRNIRIGHLPYSTRAKVIGIFLQSLVWYILKYNLPHFSNNNFIPHNGYFVNRNRSHVLSLFIPDYFILIQKQKKIRKPVIFCREPILRIPQGQVLTWRVPTWEGLIWRAVICQVW